MHTAPSLSSSRDERVPATRIGIATLVIAAVLASGMPAALIEARPVRIVVGLSITTCLVVLTWAAGRITALRTIRECLLALAALSVFGWASATISALPAVSTWLSDAPVPLAFLAVNAMKLTSVITLLVIAARCGWSRERFLVRVGDPFAVALVGVRWPVVAVPVMLVVAALFLSELPSVAFDRAPDLVGWIPVVLAGAVVNALAEELLYRHGLIGTMRRVIGVWPAVVLSSAAFGLAHTTGTPGGPSGVLFTAVYGLICALAMLQTRGMLWNTTIHIAGDIAAVSALFLATHR